MTAWFEIFVQDMAEVSVLSVPLKSFAPLGEKAVPVFLRPGNRCGCGEGDSILTL